jgi:hypothetical protein
MAVMVRWNTKDKAVENGGVMRKKMKHIPQFLLIKKAVFIYIF